ncbi:MULTISPECIES: YybH family protein [unclassified Luteimonas]
MALAGCGEPEPTQGGQVAPDAPLPGPQQAGGSVTDMPAAPGPGGVPLAGSPPPPPPPEPLPGNGSFGLPPLEQNPEAGLVAPGAVGVAAAPAPATSGLEDPRDVLRGYYAAINARDFPAAHAAWSDGQGAEQTPAQFAATFAGTTSIELTVGEPRPAEGAAGSVYVEVPVTVTSSRADGSVQHQAGRYTLRRSQVDGATAAQRAWRIAAVDLRDAAR